MKKMKKALSLLLSVAMILSLVAISVSAAEAPTATLGSPAGVLAGSEVVVDLTLSDNPGLVYLFFEYSYDKSALELVEATDKGLLGTYVGNGSSTLVWQNATATENFTAKGVIASLKFKVKEGTAKGEYPITLTFDQENTIDKDFNPVEFTPVSGKVTVIEETNITSITKENVSVPYGANAEELKAVLPKTVKGQGKTTGGSAVTDMALEVEAWDTSKLNVTPSDMNAQTPTTITATLKAKAGVNVDPAAKAEADVTIAPLTAGVASVDGKVSFAKEDASRKLTEDEIKAAVAEQIGKVAIAKADDANVKDEYAITKENVTAVTGEVDASVLTEGENNKAVATISLTGKSAKGIFNLGEAVTAKVDVVVVPAEIKDEKVASYKIDPTNIKPSTKLSLTVNRAETFADKDSKVTVDMYIVPAEGAEAQKVTVDKDVDKADMIMSKAVAGVQDNPGTTEDETVEAKEAELTKTFKLDSVTKYLTNAKAGDKIRFEVKLDGATIYVGEKAYTQKMLASNTSSSNRPGGVPSGNGGGTTTAKTFNIKTTESENGTFKVQATAKAGDVVTITTTPAEGFKTDKITVVKADKTNVPVDGKKFTMPSSDVTVSVTFVEGVEEDENNKPASGDFTDVPSSHWAYQAVMNLKKLGIVNGNTETTFDPDGNVTRAEFAKMVAQLFSLKATATESAFTDCTASDWYTPYVIAATEAGYVKGMSEDFFGANEQISRQDICTVLGRALSGIPTPAAEMSFADADEIADYALEYVQAFVDLKIVNGYEDGTFKPAASATRAEAAKIIDGVTKLDNQAIKDAIAKLTGEAADEKTDAEADEKTDANADEKTDAEADEKTDANADEKTDAKADEKTDAKAE